MYSRKKLCGKLSNSPEALCNVYARVELLMVSFGGSGGYFTDKPNNMPFFKVHKATVKSVTISVTISAYISP